MGSCKFDDCMFEHVAGGKLTQEERAQVLWELPKRPWDPVLGEVIKQLNIPRCKDFHQRGGCKQLDGKCHFWHLTGAAVAKWAGFGFWCEACQRPLTSEQQLIDHKASQMHRDSVGSSELSGETATASGPGASRGKGTSRGGGAGRGYPDQGSGRGDGRGGSSARGRGRGYA